MRAYDAVNGLAVPDALPGAAGQVVAGKCLVVASGYVGGEKRYAWQYLADVCARQAEPAALVLQHPSS